MVWNCSSSMWPVDTELGEPGAVLKWRIDDAGMEGGGAGRGAYWDVTTGRGNGGMLGWREEVSMDGRVVYGESVEAPPFRFPAELALCSSPRTSSRSGRASILGRPRVLTSSRAFHVSSRTVSTPGRRLFKDVAAAPSAPVAAPRKSLLEDNPVSFSTGLFTGFNRFASAACLNFLYASTASAGGTATDQVGLSADPKAASEPPGGRAPGRT
jgi:hypothetical protein